MSNVQVPPPVGSSGQHVDALIINAATSELRQLFVVADPVSSSAMATVTTSGGLKVHLTNPSTAVTVTNPSTAVTITNPSTEVNVLTSGPLTISGTVNVVSASSGLIQISGIPTVIAASSAGHQVGSLTSGLVSVTSGTFTLSSNPTVISTATTITSGTVTLSSAIGISSGVVSPSSDWTVVSTATTITSGTVTLSSVPTVTATAATNPWSSAPSFNVPVVNASSGIVQAWLPTQTGAGFGTVTSSWGIINRPAFSQSSSRLIIATSVSKISSAPGVLTFLSAISTSIALDGRYLRLYDQTTGNATSSSNSGLAGACALFRILTSVAATPVNSNTIDLADGIAFGTACSFDIVVAATSTAANATGGWVTAQYTS